MKPCLYSPILKGRWVIPLRDVRRVLMPRLDELPLARKDRLAVEEAGRLLRARFPVAEVVFFGSKARGGGDEESDIDLLVLTTRQLSRAERHTVMDALFPIQLAHDVVLSPLVIARDDWKTGPMSILPLRAEIDEQGIPA